MGSPQPTNGPLATKTGGAALLLAVVLVAYTIQTELASHVQHQLGYKKPFFLFYLTHRCPPLSPLTSSLSPAADPLP